MPCVKHSLLSVDNVCVKNQFTDKLQSITKELLPSFEGRKKQEKKGKFHAYFNVIRYNHYNFKYFLKRELFHTNEIFLNYTAYKI